MIKYYKFLFFVLVIVLTIPSFAQQKKEYAYPLTSLKQLPVLEQCSDFKDDSEQNLICLKTEFEKMFTPYIKKLPKLAKQDIVEVYIEFTINKDNTISMPRRVIVSEEKMGDYVKEGYKQFRRDFIQNKTDITPGINRNGQEVNTLFAIRIKKRLR